MNMRLLLLVVTIGCLSGCASSRSSQTENDYISLDGNDSRVQSATASNYDSYVYANSNPGYETFASPDFGFGFSYGLGFGYSPWYNPFGFYGPYGFYSPYYSPFAFEWGPMGYAGGFYYPYAYYPYYTGRFFNGAGPAYAAAYGGATVHNNFTKSVNSVAGSSVASRTISTNRFSSLASSGRLSLKNTNGFNTNDRIIGNRANNFNSQPIRSYSPSSSRFGGGSFGGGSGARFGGGGFGGGRRG